MANFVEGDWKNFTFKMVTPEDYPRVLEHLRQNFYMDEPLNKYMGQSEAKNKDMDTIALVYLEQNLSFFAVEKSTNKVVGARVTGISREGDNLEELFALLESQEVKDLIPSILELYQLSNTMKRLEIDNYGDFLFVSVDKEFRGQGLATEMYERAIKQLKSIGIPAAQSIFTSPKSQSIAKKLGFTELARKYFKDYKKLDGSPLLPEANEDEVGIVMALKF